MRLHLKNQKAVKDLLAAMCGSGAYSVRVSAFDDKSGEPSADIEGTSCRLSFTDAEEAGVFVEEVLRENPGLYVTYTVNADTDAVTVTFFDPMQQFNS
ncbi:MAG: hypothetical protein LUD72_05205 [Bacteroidales bacterium]|nr:hypothetical protein [Bacteroidales bacterium]